MGEAVGIIVGQILGTGDIDKAKDHAVKIRDFTVFCGLICGLLMVFVSPFFPKLYNVSADVKTLASTLILICGVFMPFIAFTHASYFTIRAGGNTLITFFFDSCFVWIINVPIAYCLSRYTDTPVYIMLLIIQATEIIKCIIGGAMVRSGIWARNIVQ